MVIFLAGILLGIIALVWLWKVPVKHLLGSLEKSGSSTLEAYVILILLTGGMAFAVYMIMDII